MDRISAIKNNKTYIDAMSYIDTSEEKRKFCLHGLEHSLDVARICYIINLEEQLGYKKDVIYAMALLHDIGRCKEYKEQISHHQAGAELAADILGQAGFKADEIKQICDAIASHKHVDENKDLKYLLYRGDKLSRNCFNCKMYKECYWNEDLKNKEITY